MKFTSINPHNGDSLNVFEALSESELTSKLALAGEAFESWKNVDLKERVTLLQKLAIVLKNDKKELALTATLEMGKPIVEAKAEIDKCAWVCEYYAEHAEDILKSEIIQTEASHSLVRHDPIGAVLAIMPWNFPFWQVFRFAAPVITAGNVGLLKHAPNVFGCAQLIEGLFEKAGYPKGVFQNLITHHEVTESIISHQTIQGVTLTGSERAGSIVAALAGKHLKKSLMELGGNNAFIVWKDASIEDAVDLAINARMLNAGQSCIAAKRFILVADVYQKFVDLFVQRASNLQVGYPLEKTTQIGPLARKDLADQLKGQIDGSVSMGAELLLGGQQNGCYIEPTVLGNVSPGMPAFDQETFGPLAAMIKAKDEEDAFRLANLSRYGLGMTVCTKNVDLAMNSAGRAEDGAYFVNELVKSDPRLPFGGQKKSGYGRELGPDGMLAFVNRKTIYVK